LAELPVEVAIARDGIEALESVESNQPDLVVLDVMMPRMGGFEVCGRNSTHS
jgi:CheY-like chemotaxis protein